jgi:hypothetical protein
MADTFKFYCERADAAAAAAKQTTLENVRERELRAEKTWRGLAMKAQAVATQREEVEREKAERRAAEIELEQQARDRFMGMP